MEYAITKRGKGVADDWIAYAIACESDPKAIAIQNWVRLGIYAEIYSKTRPYLPSRDRMHLLDICWLQLL